MSKTITTSLRLVRYGIVNIIALACISCSVVDGKRSGAIETLQVWQSRASRIPPSSKPEARKKYNEARDLVDARISTFEQEGYDAAPWLVTQVDLSNARLDSLKPKIESYLDTTETAPASPALGGAAAAEIAKWLYEAAKANRKHSADMLKERLEKYRWKAW